MQTSRTEQSLVRRQRLIWIREHLFRMSLPVTLLWIEYSRMIAKTDLVLDGFPRTIPQAKALDDALTKIGEKMDYAIDVDVPDENIVNRMVEEEPASIVVQHIISFSIQQRLRANVMHVALTQYSEMMISLRQFRSA